MRRYFVAGSLILVTALGTFFAIGGGPGEGPTTGRIQRPARYGGRVWPVPPVALAASTNLCDYLAAGDKAGNWWCVNGDGSQPAGSVALAVSNAPTVVTYNGAAQTRLNPSATSDEQYYATATRAGPGGSFTSCMIATKIDQANADYTNFSDHAGGYGFILQDNGTLARAFDFSAVASNTAAPRYIEEMECTIFISGVSTSVCVYAASEFTGCSSPTAVSTTAIPTPFKWLAGGGAVASYNLRGFFRGAFMTEKALTNSDLVRISALLSPNPPSAWTGYLDGSDQDLKANSSLSDLATVSTWNALAPLTANFTNATAAGTPRINTGDQSISFSGVNDFLTSSGGAADWTFIHNTGVFDIAVTVRRRGTSLGGAPRRILGNAASSKGIVLSVDEAGHIVVNLYNGSGDIAAFTTSTATVPIGVPTSFLVRGDGTNVKVSTDFSTFSDTKALTGSPGGAAATDMGIGASGTGETANIHRWDGDISQVLVYPANLNGSQLTQLKAYLDARRSGKATQRVWAAIGDSLTEGLSPVYPWPHRVTGALRANNVSVANHGKSSDDTAGATTRWTSYIKDKGYYGVVLAIGVNDILSGVSAATLETSYGALIADIQSSGLKVAVCTITPFGNYGGYSAGKETERLAFNTWLRARSVDAVIDVAPVMGSVSATNLDAAFDIGDGLHFNDTGNAAYATPVAAAIAGL